MLCFVSLCSIGGELQAIFSCRERKRLGVSQVFQQKITKYHSHQKYVILYSKSAIWSHDRKGNFSDSCIHSTLFQLPCYLFGAFVDDFEFDKALHRNKLIFK